VVPGKLILGDVVWDIDPIAVLRVHSPLRERDLYPAVVNKQEKQLRTLQF
jgi:hypothetical protein